jgi:5-methyltetrahydrofolate--homocysteine methyltransferase
MVDYSSLREAVLTGNAPAAVAAARQALDTGAPPVDLVTHAISPAMAKVGDLFEAGEYFVPELLISARATKEVFELIRPLLAQTGAKPSGRVVLGTVQGDLHDIGKNLVAALLEGNGFEVIDLGVDVAPDRFVAAVNDNDVQLIGLSALLTTTMVGMQKVLEAFDAAGVRQRVKVMIGGAPVTQSFASSIGADGFGENATAAVDLARKLLSA